MTEVCCPHCEEQYRELLERRERHIAALEAENARLRAFAEKWAKWIPNPIDNGYLIAKEVRAGACKALGKEVPGG